MTTKEAIQIIKKWYEMGNDGLITGLTENQLKRERDMALEQFEELQHSFKTTMSE